MGSLAGFKRGSRDGFLAGYGAFVCVARGCYVCNGGATWGPLEGKMVRSEGSDFAFFLWFNSVSNDYG